MNVLFRELLQLCLFRSTPARLPNLPVLTLLLLLADWLLSVVVISTLSDNLTLTQIVVNVGVAQVALGLLIFAALRLRQLDTRWAQTLSAIFGCDLLLTALFGGLLPIGRALGENPYMMLEVLLQLWTITLYGYLLHLAMEMPLLAGILTAFGILVIGLSVTQALTGG
ncbi:MAG: hypothetical protein ACR2PZ_11950 [Pseudomonadales bacterium]